MEYKSGIYKIINQINGNFYIGSSKNLKKRWKHHKYQLNRKKHINIILQRSWDKYKEENFEFDIIEYCNQDKLFEIEQIYLDKLKPKYNIGKKSCGGDNITNNPKRDDIRRRISDTLKQNYINKSDEYKLNYSEKYKGIKNPNYGNNWNDEMKKHNSQQLKNYYKTHSQKHKGKKLEEIYNPEKSESIRKKLSENASKRTGEKNSFFGKHHTDETKNILRQKRLGKYYGNQNIPFTIDGIEYNSLGNASKELGIHITTIKWRLGSKNEKFENYKYI